MGLFSFLGKVVGRVAKAGLGVATGGISTQILDTVGGIIRKKKAAVNQENLYQAAGLTDDFNPPARRTEIAMPGSGLGRAFRAYGSTPADVEAPKPRRRRRRRAAEAPAPRRRRRRGTGRRRAPPRGGLDLKAMSVAWRGAGSPGTWQEWIRANPIRQAR